MNFDIDIAVVYGGISTERDVSLLSGKAVYDALRNYGYKNVWLFDFNGNNILKLIEDNPDIAFLALHGGGGEDGCIQGALELADIPYTGSGVACSAICMNKVFAKQVLTAANIPTARYMEFRKSDGKDVGEISERMVKVLSLPMVLKSPCQGSSIGVYIVKNFDEMEMAINSIFELGDQILAEEYLEGIEISLPIIGNDEITILPEIEITSGREFYDYQAKYTQGLSHHIIPSQINEEERYEIRKWGKKVYKEFNCRGLSRIDFIIDKNKGPMVIEINTLPGMTAMSLVPDAARAAGISFEQLTSQLIQFGLQEHGNNKWN